MITKKSLYVKITTKVKAIIFLLDLFLVVCGMLFLGSFFNKKTNIKCELNKPDKIENNKDGDDVKKNIINELTECQNELFKYQNEAERLKLMPDVRKDVVNLLLSLHSMEQKIGQEANLSSDCIKLFSLSARIPVLQEYTNKYRSQMFSNNCIFLTNEDILKLIVPFQLQFLEKQQEMEQQEQNGSKKWHQKLISSVKYNISKLFVKSQIKKSELEIAIENSKYKQAKQILEDIKLNNIETKEQQEQNKNIYSTIYNAVNDLNDLHQMIDNIYLILRNNN